MKIRIATTCRLRIACALFATATVLATAACGGSSTSSNNMTDTPQSPPRIEMSSNQEIFGFVKDVTGFGERRTGSEASRQTADYIAAKFKDFGLQEVSIQQGDSRQWNATKWGLEVAGKTIPSFYMRHSFHQDTDGRFSTGPNGLSAEVVYVGTSKDLQGFDVRGKIVVADVELTEMDMQAWMKNATYVHDPKKTIALERQFDPFTPNNFPFNFEAAQKGGAAGIVLVLSNYFDSNTFYNEDVHYLVEDEEFRFRLPALWLSWKDGAALRDMLKQNPKAVARLTLEGTVETVKYRAVVGHLPGKSKETLMVQSHHDSGFLGAVEDASGVAEVLALAKYYGRQPAATRERGMMFVTMDTHFTGYEAHGDLARNYILKGGVDVVANVTVEHIARETTVRNGEQVLTGQVQPRVLITSPTLLDVASQKVRKHDYQRSLVLSTDLFAEQDAGIPTDVGTIQKIVGFPVVSLVSAPVYLYDQTDTLDKVAEEELQPTAMLLADLIDDLDEMARDKLGAPQRR